MVSNPASTDPAARLRLGALLLLLGLAPGCGSGAGAGPDSHDARLAALSVSVGELVPAFSPDIYTYSLDVGGLAAGIVVSPTAVGAGTSICIGICIRPGEALLPPQTIPHGLDAASEASRPWGRRSSTPARP